MLVADTLLIPLTHHLGFSADEEPLILNELCENSVKAGKAISRKDGSQFVFQGQILLDHWQTSIGTKVYFSGYSEQILGRKFEYMGINKQNNTWIYKPLPMSLVRYERGRGRTAHPQCSYLGANHIYGHIRTTEYRSAALEIACVYSILSLYHRADSCESNISSVLLASKPEILLDVKQDCENTFFNETNRDEINFLPYLIKVFLNHSTGLEPHQERCLTIHEPSLNLSLEPCIRYIEFRSYHFTAFSVDCILGSKVRNLYIRHINYFLSTQLCIVHRFFPSHLLFNLTTRRGFTIIHLNEGKTFAYHLSQNSIIPFLSFLFVILTQLLSILLISRSSNKRM